MIVMKIGINSLDSTLALALLDKNIKAQGTIVFLCFLS